MLNSARRLFATRGYGGTSTRDLAVSAGVNENSIFRHFGSKASLFRAGVLEPFQVRIGDFVDSWEHAYVPGSTSIEELTGAWVQALHALMCEQRELVMALISATSSDDAGDALLTGALARPLERLECVTKQEMARRGMLADPAVAVRAGFAAVMAMTVLDDWFLSGGVRPPATATVARELADLIVHGICHSPAD